MKVNVINNLQQNFMWQPIDNQFNLFNLARFSRNMNLYQIWLCLNKSLLEKVSVVFCQHKMPIHIDSEYLLNNQIICCKIYINFYKSKYIWKIILIKNEHLMKINFFKILLINKFLLSE